MSNDAFRHTLSTVLEQLKTYCKESDTRNIADLQRNAMLWLALRAGTPLKDSTFRLNSTGIVVDPSRLPQSVYLGAIGFLAAHNLVTIPNVNMACECMHRVLRSSAHTVEGRGFADDPLGAVGLMLLASRLNMPDAISLVREAIDFEMVCSPIEAFCLALVDAHGSYSHREVFSVNNRGHLAAAVLAGRIDAALAHQMFTAITPEYAENALKNKICRYTLPPCKDLEAMLVLSVLELPQTIGSSQIPPITSRPHKPKQKTILFFEANPLCTQRLQTTEEVRSLQDRLKSVVHRDSIDFRPWLATRPDDLLQKLSELRPYIVHFSGHGTKENQLILHGNHQDEKRISAESIVQLFHSFKEHIRIIVLSACFSSEQARKLAQFIDCVIGINEAIPDEAARKFAEFFYSALSNGYNAKEAFDQGRAAIKINEMDGADILELHLREGVSPQDITLIDSRDMVILS